MLNIMALIMSDEMTENAEWIRLKPDITATKRKKEKRKIINSHSNEKQDLNLPEYTWIRLNKKYPMTIMKFSCTANALCWLFQMTMGRRKNFAIFAKHIALQSNVWRFGWDWKSAHFFKLTASNVVRIQLSGKGGIKSN